MYILRFISLFQAPGKNPGVHAQAVQMVLYWHDPRRGYDGRRTTTRRATFQHTMKVFEHNHRTALDGAIMFVFHVVRHWRRASERGR